ncbi:MAG: cobalamin-dependent protein [Candidatus Omnitrophota bacterium]
MRYKVGIINPGTRKVIEASAPLNIMGLAAYLKQNGINVKIIDEISGDDVVRKLVSFSPDIVGFTATTCTYPRACQLLKMIKPMKFLAVIGGVNTSTFTPLEIENFKRRLLTKIYMLHPKIRRRFMIKMIRHPFLMLEKVIDYIPFMSSKKAS